MKVVALGRAKNELSAYVDQAQHERVLVTRHLFASKNTYGELASALEERKPVPRFDA